MAEDLAVLNRPKGQGGDKTDVERDELPTGPYGIKKSLRQSILSFPIIPASKTPSAHRPHRGFGPSEDSSATKPSGLCHYTFGYPTGPLNVVGIKINKPLRNVGQKDDLYAQKSASPASRDQRDLKDSPKERGPGCSASFSLTAVPRSEGSSRPSAGGDAEHALRDFKAPRSGSASG